MAPTRPVARGGAVLIFVKTSGVFVMLSLLLLAALSAAPSEVVATSNDTMRVASPAAWTLSGRVTDSTGAPIANARVVIEEAHRSTVTNADGRYRLAEVPEGTYGVSFRAIGFRPRVVRLVLREDRVADVVLAPSLVELAPIQTTATPLATSSLESPQPLSVLQGEQLAASQAASLGAVLEGLPGLRNFSTGNGIGKPVIRGLTSNRVLVLDNGQRLENQQWGDEHGPNVETATAERIEVIRGPASVLYGSDALGGVINVVPRELPDASGRRGILRGTASATYGTNGQAPEGSLLVEGASRGLGFRGTLTGRSSDDVSTPTGELFNSGLDMLGGSAALGTRGSWGSLTATYTRRAERLEIHEDPEEEPDATKFQRVAADRAMVTGNLSLGSSRLEVDLGFEQNRRREYESIEAEDEGEIELGLLSKNYLANVHLHFAASAQSAVVIGVQGMRTDFEKFGEETLIPGSRSDNVGVYAFQQADLGRWQLSAGARYDWRRLQSEADDELGLDTGERTWNSVTGNLGLLYRLSDPMAVVVNLGRGFRAPSPFELYSNGVHEGTIRFEIGDATLDNETSLNADIALRAQSRTLQMEVGAFVNSIDNYIYPDPTADFDPESGFRIYNVVQGDARLAGFEGSLEYHPTSWLHLRGAADYTRGTNRATDQPLAFIAPFRLTGSVRLEGTSRGALQAPYLSAGVETNAKQGRPDPEDFAPEGYTLANLGAGVGIAAGAQTIRFDLQVRNLFDAEYRSFLSRYKLYANDPGRNVIVRMSVDF
ncbi:MAG TPA: TonB-dependent receptor [Gemmatimonadales bacterium]|nr:TonB-dependent receptor [Gemmatimonadales bacterium]